MIKKITLLTFLLISQIIISQNTSNFDKYQKEYKAGNITIAINYLKKAIENEEKEKGYLYQVLGEIYDRQKDFKNAARSYEKVLDYNPKDNLGMLYFAIGTNYYFSQEYKKAINYLEKVLKLDYPYPGAANNLGWCYSEIGKNKKAIKYFKIAYNNNPKFINNINNLGYAYYLNKEYDKAKKYILEAKKTDKNNSFIYRNLGLIAMKENDKEKACIFLNKAIEKGIIKKWGVIYIRELKEYCEKN